MALLTRFYQVDYADTVAGLPSTASIGCFALVLAPPSIYAYTATGWVQVAAPSGSSVGPASETQAGIVELATAAETQTGTDNVRAIHPAGLKAAMTPEAWISPVLQNGWVAFGTPVEAPGYRKTPWGEVQLRGTIKSGTTTTGTVLFNLPVGYRPANQKDFVTVQGNNTAARIIVLTNGDVQIAGVTANAFLSLESVRFDV